MENNEQETTYMLIDIQHFSSFSSLFGGLWNIGDSALYLFFLRHTPHEILLLIPPSRPTVLFMSIITPIITQTIGEVFINHIYIFAREHVFPIN